MDLSKFIEDPARHAALAERIGTSKAWLWQIATGWRGKRASFAMAQDIELASGVIGPEPVPKSTLRPDIWPPAKKDGDQIADAGVDVEAPKAAENENDGVHAANGATPKARAA